MNTDARAHVLAALATWVVKQGVSLGGLTDPERLLALAVAAHALRPEETASEAVVNARLKACLAAEAAFLATDHVELRRWLVDTGWWQRDAWGRAYERTPPAALRPPLQPLAQALDGLDFRAWVQEAREARDRERQARRQAWAQHSSGP